MVDCLFGFSSFHPTGHCPLPAPNPPKSLCASTPGSNIAAQFFSVEVLTQIVRRKSSTLCGRHVWGLVTSSANAELAPYVWTDKEVKCFKKTTTKKQIIEEKNETIILILFFLNTAFILQKSEMETQLCAFIYLHFLAFMHFSIRFTVRDFDLTFPIPPCEFLAALPRVTTGETN